MGWIEPSTYQGRKIILTSLVLAMIPTAAWAKGPIVSLEEGMRNLSHAILSIFGLA